MRYLNFIMLFLLSITCKPAYGHDFVAILEGQKVYFDILDNQTNTAMVTYHGSIRDFKASNYEGELAIPPKVKHKDIVYTIVGVNAKAFSNAVKLTSVIFPASISFIGDFAFEGCVSLNKIVFNSKVKVGEGAFFKCDKIQDVTIGNDWTEINLRMFSWSDSLISISIPEKIGKIKNLKALKYLQTISVDSNNVKFSSHNGVLYNKLGNILYACPRAYTGKLQIIAGTQTINEDAISDCREITVLDFPRSLKTMSFRELRMLANLETIVFHSDTPILTGTGENGDVFLLQIANPELEVIVPRKSKEKYVSALIQEAGEYRDIDGTVPYLVKSDEILKVKNIKTVKN